MVGVAGDATTKAHADSRAASRAVAPAGDLIGHRLLILARLSGWPVMFAAGNWLSDTPVHLFLFNTILIASFLVVVLTQLVFDLELRWRGTDLLGPLLDGITLFSLSFVSGGVNSPIRSAYFLFILINAIGLRVRIAMLVALLYAVSWASLEVFNKTGVDMDEFEARLVFRFVLYLLWTALVAGLLAAVLRVASARARAAADENAMLYERAARTGGELLSVLHSTANGILMAGIDGRIRFANRRVGELWGIDLTGIAGRSLADVVEQMKVSVRAPDAFVAGTMAMHADPEGEHKDEIELTTPDHRVLLRNSAPVHDEDGNLLGRIDVYHDITQQRASERLKAEFLSLVSHELKTPITSLKAYAQLLNRKPIAEISPAVVQRALNTIDRQASQLNVLVNDLLDISRADTGHLELHRGRVDLAELVRQVVEQFAVTAADHKIVMETACPTEVYADSVRIEQVLVNLLTNAVKYSARGTEIRVRVMRDGERAVVSVSDQGIGIPEESRSRIFDRFYQARGSQEYSFGGMGIGLYVSREIVERHGGDIRVESEEDKGSTFSFRLPLIEQAPAGS